MWNANRVTGMLAVFNLQGASWDRQRRRFHTHAAAPPTLGVTVYPQVRGG